MRRAGQSTLPPALILPPANTPSHPALTPPQVYVRVEESIRGCDVFLVQPTAPPVNDHLMELLIMIDACRRASARSITVVMPYFGYARADRKTHGRESITAKLVANLITKAGAECAPQPGPPSRQPAPSLTPLLSPPCRRT